MKEGRNEMLTQLVRSQRGRLLTLRRSWWGSLLVVFGCLQLLDAVTTSLALSSGRGREGNPMMATLIDSLGIGGFVVAKIVLLGVAIGWVTLLWHIPGSARRWCRMGAAALVTLTSLPLLATDVSNLLFLYINR